MSRPDPKSPRRDAHDQDSALDLDQQAEVDAAAEILAMLTSRRVVAEFICDADGLPLNTSPFERHAMWF